MTETLTREIGSGYELIAIPAQDGCTFHVQVACFESATISFDPSTFNSTRKHAGFRDIGFVEMKFDIPENYQEVVQTRQVTHISCAEAELLDQLTELYWGYIMSVFSEEELSQSDVHGRIRATAAEKASITLNQIKSAQSAKPQVFSMLDHFGAGGVIFLV